MNNHGGKLVPESIVRFRRRQRGQKKKASIFIEEFTNGVNNVEWIPGIFFTSNMAHVYQTTIFRSYHLDDVKCFLKQVVNGFHNI